MSQAYQTPSVICKKDVSSFRVTCVLVYDLSDVSEVWDYSRKHVCVRSPRLCHEMWRGGQSKGHLSCCKPVSDSKKCTRFLSGEQTLRRGLRTSTVASLFHLPVKFSVKLRVLMITLTLSAYTVGVEIPPPKVQRRFGLLPVINSLTSLSCSRVILKDLRISGGERVPGREVSAWGRIRRIPALARVTRGQGEGPDSRQPQQRPGDGVLHIFEQQG